MHPGLRASLHRESDRQPRRKPPDPRFKLKQSCFSGQPLPSRHLPLLQIRLRCMERVADEMKHGCQRHATAYSVAGYRVPIRKDSRAPLSGPMDEELDCVNFGF